VLLTAQLEAVVGTTEETTPGINRLIAMEKDDQLSVPAIDGWVSPANVRTARGHWSDRFQARIQTKRMRCLCPILSYSSSNLFFS